MRQLTRRHQAEWTSFAVVVIVRMIVLTPAAHGGLPTMPAIARDGFGDSQNSYAWSMTWFKGALYVGTARSALCVERATLAYYLPHGNYYTRQPAPGVSCPPTIHDADLRAEIWRYTPARHSWKMVYRSSTVRDPLASGRRVARDIGYRNMLVVKGRRGGRALYVAGVSADEFIPELARRYPPRILRTTDGTHFRALRGAPRTIHSPFGVQRPIGYRAMAALHDKLYVTASGGLTGDGVVLRVDDPAGASPTFRQVSPTSLSVFELQRFDGRLYAGTGDFQRGYGVWRIEGARGLDWTPVVTGGAGRGKTITSVVSMQPYRGRLYVGASGWATSSFPSSELIRVAPDGSWDLVVGNARQLPDGTVKAPVSGLGDGFGNPFNSHFWRMQPYRGALLLGTNDWSWSLRGTAAAGQVASELGFDLYGTCDGNNWWVATRDGFGRPDDFGVRTMAASSAGLFLGTTNLVEGTTIRRSRADPCGAGAPSASSIVRAHPERRGGR